MLDFYQCLIIVSLVVVALCDECYYDDGSIFGRTVSCPGSCCGTGIDPCCWDSGSVMAFSIGGVMTAVLLMVCLIVYCVQRSYAKKSELQRLQSGSPELNTVTNQYHMFDSNGNHGQMEVPPRYSHLFPGPNQSDTSSMGTTRTSKADSIGSRNINSFRRDSATRISIRRGRSSGSLTRQQHNAAELNQNRESASSIPVLVVEPEPKNEPSTEHITHNPRIEMTNDPPLDGERT